MSEIWNDYLRTEPYWPSLVGQGDGVYILRIYEETPPPQEFAVAVGEWINHLRSALDYTVWATAAHTSGRLPPPGEGQLQYPIYDSEKAWKSNLRRLDALADHHRHMLHTMQPYNSDPDANYLGWINEIARCDRHRHLSRLAGYIAVLQPALLTPAGCHATLQWGERVIYDGHADAARITIAPWDPSMEVEINPRMGIDPDIEAWSRSKFWSRFPFPDRVRVLQVFVSAEIATYEYDATGTSRKQAVLTDAYRAASDARRDPTCRRRVKTGPPAPVEEWTT
ncbi:MAG: Uncharacterized protein JWN65_4108 [Solirubrobacterales bacterium]|nr:Uncharacterized protein [Solirubrobacterales bacterium]